MVTHLLARPQSFFLTLFKCFQGQSTGKPSRVCFSAIFNTYFSSLGLDCEWHFPYGRYKICNLKQRTSVYRILIWSYICLSISFQSLFSINPNCLFSYKKQGNAIPSFSCLSLLLFPLTVLPLLREVCVFT